MRPEQVHLVPGASGLGLSGAVVGRQYYGHDAMLEVSVSEISSPVLVRVKEADMPPVGSIVRVSASGPVTVWPRPGS